MTIAEPTTVPVTVSVIVNTVDRANSLATLLAALEHQSYSHFEVIVVVGPTQDHTMDVLDQYAGRVYVLRCERANLSESRNVGLLAANGEIVAFIDDDAVPSYHWLAQIVAAFDKPDAFARGVAVVGGSVYLVHPLQPTIQHWLGTMSDLGEQQDVRLDGDTQAEGMGVFWTERPMGANMAFRRRVLLAEGGFDGYFQWVFDDADVAMRLALAGHSVRSLAEAPVYHVPASSRNRVVRTYSGRWWIVTKASTYFAVQNGRAARQPVRQVLLRVLHLIHGAWLVNWQLYHYGHISWRAMWARRLRALAAGTQGALQGFGRRRLLVTGPGGAAGSGAARQILPFLCPESVYMPSVDPISGERGRGPLARPPLRIGLIGEPFIATGQATVESPEHFAGVTRALFAMGHAVHVLTVAEERTIIFRDGAFVHAELLPRGKESLLVGVQRLVENDGIQLLVGVPADLNVAASVEGVKMQQGIAQGVVQQAAVQQAAVQQAAVQQAAVQQAAVQQVVVGGGVHAGAGVLPENIRGALQPLLEKGYQVRAVNRQ